MFWIKKSNGKKNVWHGIRSICRERYHLNIQGTVFDTTFKCIRNKSKLHMAIGHTSIIFNPMFFLCSKTTGRSSRFSIFQSLIVLSYENNYYIVNDSHRKGNITVFLRKLTCEHERTRF